MGTYLNCDSPRVSHLLADPESVYDGITSKYVVFDEIHQLANPAQVLKIGADVYKNLRILAAQAIQGRLSYIRQRSRFFAFLELPICDLKSKPLRSVRTKWAQL